jgi:pimeloyl-ACP methyl ester carboxylesterase
MFDLGFFRLVIERGVYYKDRATDEVMRMFSDPLKTRDGKYGFVQLAKSLNSRHLADLKKELRGLDMPVLIIRGEADLYLGPQISRTLHNEIRGSTLVQIKTGGHFIQLDEPDKLVGLIKDFVSGSRENHLDKGKGY